MLYLQTSIEVMTYEKSKQTNLFCRAIVDAPPKVKAAAADDKSKKAASEEKSSEAEDKKADGAGAKGRIDAIYIYQLASTFFNEYKFMSWVAIQ